jgi:hypothetical protein
MPTIRKRRIVRRNDYDESQRVYHYLLTGIDFSFMDPDLGPDGQLDSDALHDVWQQRRDAILQQHAAERGLFFRPQGFWMFDVPELRRWCDSGTMPPVDRQTTPWLGVPYLYFNPAAVSQCSPDNFESQRDFLLRHPELLTDAEKANQ